MNKENANHRVQTGVSEEGEDSEKSYDDEIIDDDEGDTLH